MIYKYIYFQFRSYGMLRKNKLKQFQHLQSIHNVCNTISPFNNYDISLLINVRTLDRVSEIKAHYPLAPLSPDQTPQVSNFLLSHKNIHVNRGDIVSRIE